MLIGAFIPVIGYVCLIPAADNAKEVQSKLIAKPFVIFNPEVAAKSNPNLLLASFISGELIPVILYFNCRLYIGAADSWKSFISYFKIRFFVASISKQCAALQAFAFNTGSSLLLVVVSKNAVLKSNPILLLASFIMGNVTPLTGYVCLIPATDNANEAPSKLIANPAAVVVNPEVAG